MAPPIAFHDVVRHQVLEGHGSRRVAEFEGWGPLTSSTLVERGEATARRLVQAGVGPGDRVVLMMANRPDYLVAWYACSRLGAIRVPVNVEARGAFLTNTLEVCRPSVVLAEEQCAATVARAVGGLHGVSVFSVEERPGAVSGVPALTDQPEAGGLPDHRPAPQNVSVIQFTSGTTGPSKGAMMTHEYEHLMAALIVDFLTLTDADTYLMFNPLFHVHAQTTFFATLMAGGTMAFPTHFSARAWADDVRRHRATVTSMLGVMLGFVLGTEERPDEHLRRLRCVWTVPAPIDSVDRLKRRYGVRRVVTSYGNTEVGMIAAGEVDRARPNCVGMPFAEHYDVAVLDTESDHEQPPGVVGECVVRPRHPWIVTQGYFDNPDATNRAFRNLWFHTGDAVRMDDEGRLYFVDRLNDRIRRRGENLASADLEAVIALHPSVEDVAVVAVPSEVDGGEDEILACIVLADGVAEDAGEWRSAFQGWLGEHLPRYARPRFVDVYDVLPKTATQKVAKHQLRRRADQRQSFALP